MAGPPEYDVNPTANPAGTNEDQRLLHATATAVEEMRASMSALVNAVQQLGQSQTSTQQTASEAATLARQVAAASSGVEGPPATATSTPPTTATNVRSLQFKPTKPKSFSGVYGDRSLTARTWLDSVANYFDACGLSTSPDKVTFASTLLDGNAARWWAELRRTGQHQALVADWSGFCQALIVAFNPMDSIDQAKQQLMSIRQKTNVIPYINRFRQLALESYLDEGTLVQMFVRGLKRSIATQIMLSRPKTLLEACTAATWIETIYYGYGPKPGTDQARPMDLGEMEFVNEETLGAVSTGRGQSTSGGAGKSKLVCYRCGKPGHKKSACRSPNSKGQGKEGDAKKSASSSN